MKYTAITAAIVGILALTSCGPITRPAQDSGSEVAAQASPTPKTLPAGPFAITTKSGAKIRFQLPTPPADPAVADIEAYRQKTGVAPVTYIVADVDNRAGTKMVNMYKISAYDDEGTEYEFGSADQLIGTWGPTYGSDYIYRMPDGSVLDEAAGTALRNQEYDLSTSLENDVQPAQRATIILISAAEQVPTEFTRVAVQPSGGMDPGEEAAPA